MQQALQMPQWLVDQIEGKGQQPQRLEIEVKFLIERSLFERVLEKTQTLKHAIEQIYLSEQTVAPLRHKLGIPTDTTFKEYRLRRMDQHYFFTAKGQVSDDGTQRREFEIEIEAQTFEHLKNQAARTGQLHQLFKTRYQYGAPFAGNEALVVLDEYHQICGQDVAVDYVVCEIEVPERVHAEILMRGRFFAPKLTFVKNGLNITGIKAFSNKKIAAEGLPHQSYQLTQAWLKQQLREQINSAIHQDSLPQASMQRIQANLKQIYAIENPTSLQSPEIEQIQDVLKDLAFTPQDSMGRVSQPNQEQSRIDEMGKGWLSDYHTIISASPFIRLHSKPQIYRPGLGNTNTTTRGAHTSDVIAAAMQIARQLGLNMELCAASAALHDWGHPAGGHVGEHVLEKFSGRKFKHHIFSLSLAEVFNLNLTREVMLGAFYHKTGGGKLSTPKGKPQEFGVVRIADKISYVPWDVFDSISNHYLKEEDVPNICFEVLGDSPLSWMSTLIEAVVKESALAHQVQFTELSGPVFEAYKAARKVVFEHVHQNIHWGLLEAELGICYDYLARTFPELDTVALVAYMTDTEITSLASLITSNPKNRVFSLESLKERGYDFIEFAQLIKNHQDPPIYYTQRKSI